MYQSDLQLRNILNLVFCKIAEVIHRVFCIAMTCGPMITSLIFKRKSKT